MMRLTHRSMLPMVVASIAAASFAGCSSSSTPLSPATTTPTTVPDASLKASAPTVQSPVNDARSSSLSSTTLVAGAATPQYAQLALQYRFQVFNDASTLVVDSGLVAGPTYTVTTTLTPLKRYTWRVRAEYQGAAGPWSSMASFTTPQQPPAYNRPIGNWQACAGLTSTALVTCVWNAVRPTDSVGDLEVVKRVAWLLRTEGAGLLIKNSGENVVLWAGYSFSASRLCFADGHLFKIIGDAGPGGANAPGFSDNDFVDPSQCVPAIDPSTP
ncbi:MAG TPA: hypothetical protein VKE96_28720 [Vicinamibacterales bacterium]|nr:hypothetical protein [Vicinamibacterales bacterium]